jgi:hypothetical protein
MTGIEIRVVDAAGKDVAVGEAVKAIVVKKPGTNVTADELIGFARERIAHYKARPTSGPERRSPPRRQPPDG